MLGFDIFFTEMALNLPKTSSICVINVLQKEEGIVGYNIQNKNVKRVSKYSIVHAIFASIERDISVNGSAQLRDVNIMSTASLEKETEIVI